MPGQNGLLSLANSISSDPITVVGATCPLGKHLIDTLLASNHSVIGICRSLRKIPHYWKTNRAFRSFEFDLCRPLVLARLLETSSQIIWLAHSPEIPANRTAQYDPNVAALSAICLQPAPLLRKIVLISSGGSVYGRPNLLPVPEEYPCKPLSVYGKSKKRLEDTLQAAIRRTSMLSGVVLRPGNIYGKYYLAPDAKGCVGAFTRALLTSEPLILVDGGRAVRDFVHVDDVVTAILAAIRYDRPFTVWNVSSGVGTRIHQVLEMICEILSCNPVKVTATKASPTDIDEIFLSIERIKDECSWCPGIDLHHGLESILVLRQLDQLVTCDKAVAISNFFRTADAQTLPAFYRLKKYCRIQH